jgi:thioesterase domain-containing protein
MELMRSFKPTFMQATPATWKMLLDCDWPGDAQLKILCGGEALPRELAGKLVARCASLWNMYGPTETTIWSTLHRVTGEEGAVVPIGRPIDATRIYILDEHQQLTPQGVTGEIYIGGEGVATGYFKNAQLTAERFLVDPFSPAPGARMYRTGDAGQWRADLNLEYMGRLDHQIKLRGFRIEPSEIEIAIRSDERVRDALVIARQFKPGDTRLVAYCVVAAEHLGDSALPGELSECLSRRLPSYMIPSAFVALREFPQTPNGKIDRKALPAPVFDQSADEEQYVAPRDEIETALQTLWQDILGVTRVGVRDNFFMLGGHSLLATRLFASIERTFKVRLQLSVLFERSTIEYLAERIRAERATQASAAAARIEKFEHLVPIQERGARPRLFCVHGAGGHVLNFWAISQHLGVDQPFYALQAPGVDGRRNPYENIEDMASAYLAELRALQPHGPYYLSGYCGGGWIAFEMANRLRAAGEEVKLLALLDSYGPNMQWTDPRVEKWIKGTLREGIRFIVGRLRARIARDYASISHAVRIRYYRWLGQPVPYELRDVWLTQAFLGAAASYKPQPYDGKVTLLLARDVEPPHGAEQSVFGWQGLVPAGLEIHEVPGTHHTLTHNPNAAELASTLLRCMSLPQS